MRPKAAWIAWMLFAFVCVATLREVILEYANLSSPPSMVKLASDLVIDVFIQGLFALVGALIISRQPRNLIGWLLLIVPITQAGGFLLPPYQTWPAAPVEPTLWVYLGVWASDWSWLLLIFPVFLIALLFPTGRPPTRRWNWVGYLTLVMAAFLIFISTFSETITSAGLGLTWGLPNPVGFIPDEFVSGSLFQTAWGTGLFILAISSVASLVVRYRRAGAVERQQIKWLLYTCGLFGALYALTAAVFFWGGFNLDLEMMILLILIPMATIPIAIGAAILRYRLWDIDVLIRRTLVYGALTAALGLVFFGGVVLLQQVFGALTGTENSPVAIVISTLVIAALFNPLRKRVQDFIDRRFYRKKYNAEQALKRFSELARNETDIELLKAEIMAVVQETMQPEKAGLWLRKAKK